MSHKPADAPGVTLSFLSVFSIPMAAVEGTSVTVHFLQIRKLVLESGSLSHKVQSTD